MALEHCDLASVQKHSFPTWTGFLNQDCSTLLALLLSATFWKLLLVTSFINDGHQSGKEVLSGALCPRWGRYSGGNKSYNCTPLPQHSASLSSSIASANRAICRSFSPQMMISLAFVVDLYCLNSTVPYLPIAEKLTL